MTRLVVADLICDDLNIAVAMADGHAVRRSSMPDAPGIHERWPGGNWEWIRQPSTAWEHGGPIIERERMALDYLDGEWHVWSPSDRKFDGQGSDASGPTPLIAAMRAYVASKLGETVGVVQFRRILGNRDERGPTADAGSLGMSEDKCGRTESAPFGGAGQAGPRRWKPSTSSQCAGA